MIIIGVVGEIIRILVVGGGVRRVDSVPVSDQGIHAPLTQFVFLQVSIKRFPSKPISMINQHYSGCY